MSPEQFENFTNVLTTMLKSDDRVLGLIALGSMADEKYRDQWSDHDFWVITTPDAQEDFLNDLSWLPDHRKIIVTLRQAPQYYTILYSDGHIVEFAVFNIKQLERGKLNNYQILFDKQDIGRVIHLIYEKTSEQSRLVDPTFEFGNFLVHIWVGLARYWRGEKLSSHKYLSQFALDTLLSLIVSHVPPQGKEILDNLDVRRRFELAYPVLSKELDIWSSNNAPGLAIVLLDIADGTLSATLPDYPHQAVATLRQHIQ